MRSKLGSLCMILGTALVIAALSLFLWNSQENTRAGEASKDILHQLAEQAKDRQEQQTHTPVPGDPLAPTQSGDLDIPDPYDPYMTEVMVQGFYYVGYLSVPTLELELPVMSKWSYYGLQYAPCRYFGSTKTNDLAIVAHNYDVHFGRIDQLVLGDSVVFTDMDGIVTSYEVVLTDIIPPDAVGDVISGDFDLTLVTCTYGGRSRVAVYCNKVV